MTDTIPGDTSSTAIISVGTPVLGNTEAIGDEDWYRITLAAGTHYYINQIPDKDTGWYFDGEIAIYDTVGNLLATSFDRDNWWNAFCGLCPVRNR